MHFNDFPFLYLFSKANKKDFRKLAEGIRETFPKENILYYYVPPVIKKDSTTGKSFSCRGRIPLKYWNKLKKIKDLSSGSCLDETADENLRENNNLDGE